MKFLTRMFEGFLFEVEALFPQAKCPTKEEIERRINEGKWVSAVLYYDMERLDAVDQCHLRRRLWALLRLDLKSIQWNHNRAKLRRTFEWLGKLAVGERLVFVSHVGEAPYSSLIGARTVWFTEQFGFPVNVSTSL
jgi:hypothetical protein